MKCKYCGAEVGLEENFCSYCGKPNDQALRHTMDMASYHRRYAATEAAVVKKSKRYSQIVLRAVLILIILIATIVMYAVTENAYSLPETMRRREAEKNPERSNFVLQLEKLFLHTDREAWIKYSASGDIRWLCQSLDDFLYEYDRAQRNEESKLFLSYMEDMRQIMTDMLRVYLGIEDDELEEFLGYSENRKALYVEEVLLHAQKSD